MNDRSIIKRFLGTVLTALLVGLLFVPVAQAKDLPLYIEYTGTGHDLVAPAFGDPLPDNIVLADAKGSFGAKSSVIVVKFAFVAPPDPPDNPCAFPYDYLGIGYARAVTSFQDGSQLFATVDPGGVSYMCIDFGSGHFFGSVDGFFIGGVGRFEGASGTYTSEFEGYNLTGPPEFEYPFRSIKGSFDGVVEF